MKKVVVISGGSDGLGKTIAAKLSQDYNVVILSPNKEKVEVAAKEIGCEFQVCDVSNYKNVTEVVNGIVNRYGKIDCIINNAGLGIEGKLIENDYESIKQVLDVNTLGTIFFSKAVLRYMTEQGEGLIVNVISQSGLYAKAERSIYNASKWAISGFTKSLQLEAAKSGVRVTGIYPGKLKTNFHAKINVIKDMTDGLETQEVARIIEFLISTDSKTVIPEIGIKHILEAYK